MNKKFISARWSQPKQTVQLITFQLFMIMRPTMPSARVVQFQERRQQWRLRVLWSMSLNMYIFILDSGNISYCTAVCSQGSFLFSNERCYLVHSFPIAEECTSSWFPQFIGIFLFFWDSAHFLKGLKVISYWSWLRRLWMNISPCFKGVTEHGTHSRWCMLPKARNGEVFFVDI